MGDAHSIRWPERFDSSRAPVHVRNELDMRAEPQKVWAALIDAQSWPQWYPNARRVEIETGGNRLSLGARFRWTTFGARIVSVVEEFVPNERIAWTGKAFGVDVYHAWLITPSANGAHALTEETQYGALARLAAALAPARMHHFHQIWLERLEERANAL